MKREEKIEFIKEYVKEKQAIAFYGICEKEDVTFSALDGLMFEIWVADSISDEEIMKMTIEEVESLGPVEEKEVTWNYLSDEYLDDIISIIEKI